VRKHNSALHRFKEDGIRKQWKPDDRWNTYLALNETFRFRDEDIEWCKVYGHSKKKGVIDKKGLITFGKQQYQVVNKGKFSSQHSTPVKFTALDGKLAVFVDADDGKYLGEAIALKAPAKPASVDQRVDDKVNAVRKENAFSMIKTLLEDEGLRW